jgi:hypothetical protein
VLTTDYTAYDPHTIPARDDERTRFALELSPSGVVQDKGLTALTVWERLLAERLEESQSATETTTITLRRVLRLDDGTYVLADLSRPVSFTAESKPRREEKHKKHEAGGGWIDTLLLDEKGFAQGRSEYVWEAALAAARELRLRGSALRRLSVLACQIVLARAGAPKAMLSPQNLPF